MKKLQKLLQYFYCIKPWKTTVVDSNTGKIETATSYELLGFVFKTTYKAI